MDFGSWSPAHLIIVGITLATIIGQPIVVLTRLKTITERLEQRMDKQDETIRQQGETFFHALQRLEDRMDKRLSDMQAETNHRFTEVSQRLSDMQAEIRDVRSEMSDVRSEMRQLNSNHIEHLNRHHG